MSRVEFFICRADEERIKAMRVSEVVGGWGCKKRNE